MPRQLAEPAVASPALHSPRSTKPPQCLRKTGKSDTKKTFCKFRLEPPNFLLKCFGFVICFFSSSKQGINFLSIPA